MKSCVRDAILFLLKNNLNTPVQNSFTKGSSCLTNLLETIESWTDFLDKKKKSFDKVPKKRLLQKLSAYGI